MYAMSHHHQPMNGGGLGGGLMDPSGTINPAALNTQVPGLSSSTSTVPQSSPRGIKRSRSPEIQDALGYDRPDEDDSKPRKRGRPPKSTKVSESPISASSLPPATQTPQLQSQQLPQTSPGQASPTKSTPTKPPVIKALPTVRDHTTDQLNPEGDEYIPREFDEAGEKKVGTNGGPLDGREYKCRTFYVPGRGDKLFMLATECARVLGYRDSYLLFNKNRSLYKIIASQAEKDDLIQQEILPYSYRSRQIAIVTARSMFRQFGSRLIGGGRRVRDDYWEAKARKQGFTEEDAAGEKRPGAAKQRQAEAAAEASSVQSLPMPQGKIYYDQRGQPPPSLGTLPMITQPEENMRPIDYSSVQRPRQEATGHVYHDQTRSSLGAEIMAQAQQTSEFSRSLNTQRAGRNKYLDDLWRREHEPPASTAEQSEGANATASSQAVRSPQMPAAAGVPSQTHNMVSHQPQGQQPMMSQAYGHQPHPQSVAQSPVRPVHQQIPAQMQHGRTPSISMPGGQHNSQFAYQQQNQIWQQSQPSPMGGQHPGMHYNAHMPSPSPHMQPSPLHAPPPQLHHSSSTGSLHGGQMGYNQGMGGMNAPNYQNVQRQQIYQQASPSPQHFMHQSTAAAQPGMQGWAPGPPQQQHGQQPSWQGY